MNKNTLQTLYWSVIFKNYIFMKKSLKKVKLVNKKFKEIKQKSSSQDKEDLKVQQKYYERSLRKYYK